jgi:hypothetical protein
MRIEDRQGRLLAQLNTYGGPGARYHEVRFPKRLSSRQLRLALKKIDDEVRIDR